MRKNCPNTRRPTKRLNPFLGRGALVLLVILTPTDLLLRLNEIPEREVTPARPAPRIEEFATRKVDQPSCITGVGPNAQSWETGWRAHIWDGGGLADRSGRKYYVWHGVQRRVGFLYRPSGRACAPARGEGPGSQRPRGRRGPQDGPGGIPGGSEEVQARYFHDTAVRTRDRCLHGNDLLKKNPDGSPIKFKKCHGR